MESTGVCDCHAPRCLYYLRMKNHLVDERPVAVYKTTISIILYELIYGAFVALLGYVIFIIDVLWGQILLGVCIAFALWGCVSLLRHTRDQIVVTPKQLTLSNIHKKAKQRKWSRASKADIPWNKIKDISSEFDIKIYNRVNIHKEVLVRLHNGTCYCIDSDLYDVLFLKIKLDAFWEECGKKK